MRNGFRLLFGTVIGAAVAILCLPVAAEIRIPAPDVYATGATFQCPSLAVSPNSNLSDAQTRFFLAQIQTASDEINGGSLDKASQHLTSIIAQSKIIDAASMSDIFNTLGDLSEAYSQRSMAQGDPQLDRNFRESVAIRRCLLRYLVNENDGNSEPDTLLSTIAEQYNDRGREDLAEPYWREALRLIQALPQDEPGRESRLEHAADNLGRDLVAQQKWQEAEPVLRMGRDVSKDDLAEVLQKVGNDKEAEPILRAQPKDRYNQPTGELAENLARQGRYAEAAKLYRPILEQEIQAEAGREDGSSYNALISHSYVGNAAFDQAKLGSWEFRAGLYDGAIADLKSACPKLQTRAFADFDTKVFRLNFDETSQTFEKCNLALALAIWGKAGAGNGNSSAMNGAFLAAQEAMQSAAGSALSSTTALRVAERAGAGDIAMELRKVSADWQKIWDPISARMSPDYMQRHHTPDDYQALYASYAAIADQNRQDQAEMRSLIAQLTARVPQYAELRAPAPLSIFQLQSDHTLLKENEVLVLVLVPPGEDRGLAFAVTREKAAWSQIALTGAQITALTLSLRAGLEGTGAPDADQFRSQALALYQGLFVGQVRALVENENKTTFLFVPSGRLAGIPPGLLITRGPSQGASWPVPNQTAWLLRDKAIAILPTASALRMLREILPENHAETGAAHLFAVADPDFGSVRPEPSCNISGHEAHALPSFGAASETGNNIAALRKALAEAPLPCTLVEAQALQHELGLPSLILHGADASKTSIERYDRDGTLTHALVVEFATHALEAGEFGLPEPALALAVPHGASDAGLLPASDVTGLTLQANWIVLSACNTAAGGADKSEDLSGLARAFFYAGAHSLLVSNWVLDGSVSAQMVPEIVRLQQQEGLTRAQALRQASLEMMKVDPNPAKWAVFSLVGEPD
jgi:CHAT domain-containing protein